MRAYACIHTYILTWRGEGEGEREIIIVIICFADTLSCIIMNLFYP